MTTHMTAAEFRRATAGKPFGAFAIPKKRRYVPALVADAFEEPATWTIGVHTRTEGNGPQHWRHRHKRRKGQREITTMALIGFGSWEPFAELLAGGGRVRITVTRLAPRTMDKQNLGDALKAAIDAIADLLGVDDGSELYDWQLGQEKEKGCGVRISMRALK